MPTISKAVAQALEHELSRGPGGTLKMLSDAPTHKMTMRGLGSPAKRKLVKISKAEARRMLLEMGYPEHLLVGGKIPKTGRDALKSRGFSIKPKAAKKKMGKKPAKKAAKKTAKRTAKKTPKKKPAKKAPKKSPKKKPAKKGKKPAKKTAKKTGVKVGKKGHKKTQISHTEAVDKLKCAGGVGLVSKKGAISKKGHRVLSDMGFKALRKQPKKGKPGKKPGKKPAKKAGKKTPKKKGPKKPRSAAQKANDKRLGEMARKRAAAKK